MKKLIAATIASIACVTASAADFGRIDMVNGSSVYFTMHNCPYGKTGEPRMGYVIDSNNDKVSDVCWVIVEEAILVVTPTGEVAKYDVSDFVPNARLNKNTM